MPLFGFKVAFPEQKRPYVEIPTKMDREGFSFRMARERESVSFRVARERESERARERESRYTRA